MIRHIVLFELDGFASDDARREHLVAIKQALEALPNEIAVLRHMHVAINLNPNEPYHFLLEAHVDSLQELPLYSDHPAHLRVVRELIAPYKKGRAAIDIEL